MIALGLFFALGKNACDSLRLNLKTYLVSPPPPIAENYLVVKNQQVSNLRDTVKPIVLFCN